MLAGEKIWIPRSAVLIVPGLVLASWVFLLACAGWGTNSFAMSTWQFPPPMDLPATGGSWNLAHALNIFVMWWLMMIAMMLPGIAATVQRQSANPAAVAGFLTGYGFVWMLFCAAATALQYALEQVGLLHPMMMWSQDARLSGGLLLAAGLYQMSALKARSLQRCRTGKRWSEPIPAGLTRGIRCLASSAPLMSLLFVGGVMNLYWIAALTVINLLENELPGPRILSVLIGAVCLILAGIVYGTR